MPRGGRRSGRPGAAYANRSDLNQPATLAPAVGPSQQYGQGAAQLRAQQAVPMSSGPAAPAATVSAAGPEQQPYSMPQLTPLDAPTARPNEPVTHGLATGPGGGPEVLAGASANDDVEAQLRATYARFPTDQLRALIEMIDLGDT